MLRQDNSVRRMDFNLRIMFIGLETEIYKLSTYQYCIYCKECEAQFEHINEKFEKEIRQVGTHVHVVNCRPQEYMEKLKGIDMDNPVDSFRASVITTSEMQEFIRAMYPEVDIIRIVEDSGIEFNLTIEVEENTPDDVCDDMIRKLLIRDIGTDDIRISKVQRAETQKENEEESSNASGNSRMQSLLSSFEVINLSLNKQLHNSAYEADYWFNNAEGIYRGELRREQMPFYRRDQKCSYMNCSVFDGINIRKALLLYDTVYIEVPIEEHLERFLALQKMTRSELVELVSMGKVVLVLTNSEKRYDIGIINDAYKENPMGVIGRRAVNTLLAAYFSQMKDRYVDNYPGIEEEIRQLVRYGMNNSKTAAVKLADYLMWPIRAKAESFGYLNSHGVTTLANYGVNKLVEEQLKLPGNKDIQEKLSFEFTVNAHPVHVAMALNATYLPFQQKNKESEQIYTDYHVADIMEKNLTFFWYGHKQFEEINKSRMQQAEEQIRLFESTDDISVLHIAGNADAYNTPEQFGRIIEKMYHMSPEERNKLVREYNNLLYEASEVRTKTSVLEWIMTGLDFVPKGPYLSSFISCSNALQKRMGYCETILERNEKKEFIKKVDQVTKKDGAKRKYSEEELDEIYVLDRIHRVARLKG